MNSSKISLLILKTVVILVGILVLGLCIFVLPAGIGSEIRGDFDYGPIMVGVYVSAFPLFVALHQTLTILNLIGQGSFFTGKAFVALRRIKVSSALIAGLYTLGLPYIFFVADRDDAPGVVALAILIVGTSFIVANVVNIFQQIIKSVPNDGISRK